MSSRPVFVPKNKRRSKKPYFHGAFTGGFSAGYYNTVGSKEGWTPRDQEQEVDNGGVDNGHSDEVSRKPNRPQQRMEDFMDEQDHNEWGGPMSVKKEYDASKSPNIKPLGALERVVAEPPSNVGRKLLRVLGWRDGSTAYVPLDSNDTASPSKTMAEDESLLTKKRLRRIRLQQTRVKIPPTKLDVCGLGFSRYRGAPEFERHLEKRKRLAEARARAATGSGGGRNVYRMSHLLDKDEKDEIENSRGGEQEHDDHNVSYETVQDFVGSKSVGGFALREDDDDVYDDNPVAKKSGHALKVDDNEYDTVVYEHNSEEEGDDKVQGGSDFGGVLASWASLQGTGAAKGASSSRGVTSDGRPPLAGFVLGGSSDSASKAGSQTVRYPGPDVPFGQTIKRHEFEIDEHPEILGEMSRSIQREMLLERKHVAAVESLRPKAPDAARPSATSDKTRSPAPMAGGTFAGLAAAMKNRFTSGDKSAPVQKSASAPPVGLHPQPETSRDSTTKEGPSEEISTSQQETASITITRTVSTFVPESLLCKRFHVHVPKSALFVAGTKQKVVEADGKGEAAYFHNEILKPAAVERAKKGAQNADSELEKQKATIEKDVNEPPLDPVHRPSMEIFKSIFEPNSASSESDEESIVDGKDSQAEPPLIPNKDTRNSTAEATEAAVEGFSGVPSATSQRKEASLVQNDTNGRSLQASRLEPENKDGAGEKQRKKRRHREESSVHSKDSDTEQRRRRKKYRSKTDESSSDDSAISSRRRKRKKERRRRDEKKRRKKHKSLRRR